MDKNAQIPKELAQLELIRTTVLVENVVKNLILLGRPALVRSIENTPESAKKEPFFLVLQNTLKYYDSVVGEPSHDEK